MEKRDLYDENRNLTGKTIFKGEDTPEGSYIVVVLVFIQNSEGKFLIQKRSERKNGLYATTGGHPKSGEDSLQGIITEVKEEIGVDLKPEDVKLYYGGRSDEERVFWDDYYVKMDIPNIEKLKLQEEEVSSVHWFTADEIIDLMKNDLFFMNHFEEFEVLLDWIEKNKDIK
jgi:8-oxo-dGTP pyrophosphatase MutT (NUDIX family)